MTPLSPLERVKTVSWNRPPAPSGLTAIPEETAVAITYNAVTQAVMMASPADLEDFAVGFSLAEGLIDRVEQIRSIDIANFDEGVDLRVWLDGDSQARFHERRRRITGPTGCGLCGVESLSQANTQPRVVEGDEVFHAAAIMDAQKALFCAQKLHAETSAVHAAGCWAPGEGMVAVREDVGRHNALDKLIGALFREGRSGAGGILLLTSRVSVEMVQKAAVLGCPVVVAVSAPTALAVRTAHRAGVTLVASARRGGFDLFTHPRRVLL